ncbi:MAG: hypothetical protein JWN95_1113 [Frankiales bacterium]|nr:hypothetical protein [Frankiales bacterium]
MVEGEETAGLQDNSLGRLLTLADGVFAIAMTLLALDLKVPALGHHPSDSTMRHALADNSASYWSFLVSFYVIASYWQRHRRVMRLVDKTHPRLFRDTILVLIVVAAMPFPASLLGNYGGTPFALALYGAFNVVAVLLLLLLDHDVRHYRLMPKDAESVYGSMHKAETWRSLAVFLLCIPAGYLLKQDGPWVLLLLAVPLRFGRHVRDRPAGDA